MRIACLDLIFNALNIIGTMKGKVFLSFIYLSQAAKPQTITLVI
jgi:hypothetical protein